MLPKKLLRADVCEGHLLPRYLGPADLPWVGRMLDIMAASVGRPYAHLQALLARPHYDESLAARRAMARVLFSQVRFVIGAALPPPVVRLSAFREAARARGRTRIQVLEAVATQLNLRAEEVERALYADLPGARILEKEPTLSGHEALLLHNRFLLQGLLLQAESVRIRADAQLRAVLRWAKLQRLLSQVERGREDGWVIALSGPLSVLRPTRKYGLAFARFPAGRTTPKSGKITCTA